MENFVYNTPTKLLFGQGQLGNLADEIRPYARRVLMVYGRKHLKEHGAYDRVCQLLRAGGIEWVELEGIHPNPRMEQVYEGIELCRSEGVQMVLAVGGGSCSDSAKAIAAGVKSDFDIWQAFEDFPKRVPNEEKHIPTDALPVGVVMTKAATGSEFDLTAVVTKTTPEPREKLLHMNPVFYPRFSICDPTLTYTLPLDETAYGIADMMSHYFEQYFTPSASTEFLDRMKEAVVQTVITCGPHALEKPDDYVPRADLMYAALWSCSAQNITGVIPEWSSHFIEHEITALTDLNHGLGMALIMPAWMRYCVEEHPEKFARFAANVWNVERRGRSDVEVGLEGIDRTVEFWRSLGIPRSLTEAGVDRSLLPTAAKRAVRFGTMGSLKPLEEADVLAILQMAS